MTWPSAAFSQEATGTITGTVVDARTRQPLPGALVELRTAPLKQAATDTEGHFRIDAVPVGSQELVVSMVGYAFTKYPVQVKPAVNEVTIALGEGPAAYNETVTVHGSDIFGARETGVAGQQSLVSGEVKQLGGMTLDDPLRAVQALAGAAASDDFYGEISVRGDSFRRLNYTLDGVPANFLQHTMKFVEDGASVAMINGDVMDQASLLRGAYSQRYYDHLGAALTFNSSEGSRERNRYNLTASGTSASGTADGPLGSEGKGSWNVSVRRSYLDLFLKSVLNDQTTPAFGFTDVLSTVGYDLSPHDQIQATVVAGRSVFDKDVGQNTLNLARATHAGWMGTGAWKHTGTTLTMTQRFFATGETYNNRNGLSEQVADGDGSDIGWRMDVGYAASSAQLVEGGVSVERVGARELLAFRVPGWHITGGDDFNAHATKVGAFGQLTWTIGNVTVKPGARVDRFSLTDDSTVSPWLQASWQASPNLTVTANAGLQHQFPDFFQVVGRRGQEGLEPERAANVDVGVETKLSSTMRLQLTVYNREERNLIDLPEQYYRVVDGVLTPQSDTSLYANRLDATSRGVEILLQRKSPSGLSGWVAYSYGRTRDTDRVTGERFDGDFDQRHTLNIFARYRLSDRTSFNARWRLGSNRPFNGYLDRAPDGSLFVGEQRNGTRPPVYSRVDVRADRAFLWSSRRLTLFVEVANLLDRDNVQQVPPSIDGRTGQVFSATRSLFPIVPSVGATLEF